MDALFAAKTAFLCKCEQGGSKIFHVLQRIGVHAVVPVVDGFGFVELDAGCLARPAQGGEFGVDIAAGIGVFAGMSHSNFGRWRDGRSDERSWAGGDDRISERGMPASGGQDREEEHGSPHAIFLADCGAGPSGLPCRFIKTGTFAPHDIH